jgi:hypothetical protein
MLERNDEVNEDLNASSSYSHQDVNRPTLTGLRWKDKECIQNSGGDIAWKYLLGRLRKKKEDNYMVVLWKLGSEDCKC